MHELSIVQSIIEIATREATEAAAKQVERIELEIGTLSGIEMNSFWFAWQHARTGSVLEHCEADISQPAGEATCLLCNRQYPIAHYTEPCPDCGSHFIDITQGKELRIKSITIS